MKLLPVVLIPNINQKILKKPFYEYTLNDAYKLIMKFLLLQIKKKRFLISKKKS